MSSRSIFSLTLLACQISCNLGLVLPLSAPLISRHSLAIPATAGATTKFTLTEETTWKMSMVLRGLKTTQGKRVDQIFTLTAKFVEDQGYEPPQGSLQLVGDTNRMTLSKSYWKLSEDPNDRKDGLWVWGLFKEPLYPYLLLQLETTETKLNNNLLPNDEKTADNNNDNTTDSIAPLQLYAQINHRRDSDLGVVLDGSYPINIRQLETVQADMFGAATVDVYESVDVGTIRIEAAASSVER
jgi:hypothetical protein